MRWERRRCWDAVFDPRECDLEAELRSVFEEPPNANIYRSGFDWLVNGSVSPMLPPSVVDWHLVKISILVRVGVKVEGTPVHLVRIFSFLFSKSRPKQTFIDKGSDVDHIGWFLESKIAITN